LPSHKEVYEAHAGQYEALVSREDFQGNILRAIEDILPLTGLDVLDLGTGTGRLAGLLAPRVRTILAFDLSPHMLAAARETLRGKGSNQHWLTAAADHRRLPLASHVADVMVSGWSVSYVAVWQPEKWRHEVEEWWAEAGRVLRNRGHVVLLESLGTGNEEPVPLPHLGNFYAWLEQAGFAKTWIRTDYRFETVELANELVGFFFGDEMKLKIKWGRTITLPECTGVWWRQL
jgi:ubiquinone/menaquinone biosynthesis C-methylase UbiE